MNQSWDDHLDAIARETDSDEQAARIDAAVERGEPVVPCVSHGWLPAYCERCHGQGWLTLSQLLPYERAAWLRSTRETPADPCESCDCEAGECVAAEAAE
jgi:hypothetical protein